MSTHAGGVIICEGLTEKLPVWTMAEDREKLIVGFDKKIIEELGHFKFDVLGLNYLSLMKNAIDNLDEPINWSTVDFEDENVYNMLCEGKSYDTLRQACINLSKEMPQSASDIAGVMEIAGQLGVKGGAVSAITPPTTNGCIVLQSGQVIISMCCPMNPRPS